MRRDLETLENVHPTLSVLIETWRDGAREWLDNIEEPPPVEAITWQPFENGPSIGGLLLHMIGCDLYWLESVVHGRPLDAESPAVAYDSTAMQDIVFWPTPPKNEWDWYLTLFTSSRKAVIADVIAFNQPEHTIQRNGREYTFQWIIAHLVEHDSYHGGQIVMLHEMWKKLHAR